MTNNYFDNNEDYYIYQVGLDAVELRRLKNKDILKAMSDDGTIKAWFKSSGLKVRNEADMAEFIDYLNSDEFMQ